MNFYPETLEECLNMKCTDCQAFEDQEGDEYCQYREQLY